MAQKVRDAVAVLRAVKPETALVFGSGGNVALRIAANHSDAALVVHGCQVVSLLGGDEILVFLERLLRVSQADGLPPP